MSQHTFANVAGMVATLIFVGSNLPMIWKAAVTKNLSSYSLSHIGLSNAGNVVNWLYVVSLPFGPIWLLHGFNTLVAAFMFIWYVRYELGAATGRQSLQTQQ